MAQNLTVFKIGGNVIDNPDALRAFLAEFARFSGPKILVHGGGKEATRLSARLDIPTQMIDGRRVTDAATIDVVTMVYAGLVNKRIVSILQSLGCDAIGLTGADASTVTATRRPAKPVDYGFVGDIAASGVNHGQISRFLDAGLVPVFCAIMSDGHGQLLNCNADSVATGVAVGMACVRSVDLVFCFEKDGVLADISDPESVVPVITPDNYAGLRASGVVSDGMIPKIDNALRAVAEGVSSVVIRSSSNILTPSGTTIRL